MIALDGGTFLMGSEDPASYQDDHEGPVRPVDVSPFSVDACAVSNARFAEFVSATGYLTSAERAGSSFVFAGLLPSSAPETRGVAGAPWWREVAGACWRHPFGPGSDLAGLVDHPVVHVSFEDARAYCSWAGRRLPAEAEWEYACRGGLSGRRFPWGDELTPGGTHRMNVWQGSFPARNTAADGWVGTAPVDAYPPNGFGLYNTTGNVWEWTASPWTDGDPGLALRGGSYLCHASYCFRYRTSARMRSTADSSAGNVGFRTARG